MTFFGQDGTKTGISYFAFIILALITNLVASTAFAGATSSANTGASDAAAIAAMMSSSQSTTMPPPGSTTPTTVGPIVAGAMTALYPGQLTIRTTKNNLTFRVRPDLSLEHTRRYTATIYPHIENGKKATIPEGWYLIRFVVVLPDQKYFLRERLGLSATMTPEERYVTHTDVLAEFRNGTFTNITFDLVYPDMTRTQTRCDLYTKIIAIDQKSIATIKDGVTMKARVNPFDTTRLIPIKTNMVPLVSVGQFIPSQDTNEPASSAPSVYDHDPIAQDLEGYIRRVNQRKENLDAGAVVDEHSYAQSFVNLKLIDWNNGDLPMALKAFKATPNAEAKMHKLLQLYQSYVQPLPNRLDDLLAQSVCLDIALMQGLPMSLVRDWYLRCRYSPYYYLGIHKNIHVRTLDTYATSATPKENYTAQIISNFSSNQSRSKDLYFSASIFPLSAFGEAFKLVPGSVTGTLGYGMSSSTTDSGIVQTFKSFKISQYIADIPIQTYRVCVAFEIDRRFFSYPIKTNGLYICDNELRNRVTVTEGYYLGSEDMLGDNNFSPQAQNVLLRGDREVNNFINLSNRFAQVVKKQPLRVGATFSNSAAIYYRMPGAVPGIISLPMDAVADIDWNNDPGPFNGPSFSQALGSN